MLVLSMDLRPVNPSADLPALNLDGRCVDLAGFKLAGFGGAGPRLFGFAYEWSEEQAGERLRSFLSGVDDVDIFLSHTPPLASALDRSYSDVDAGSVEVDRWLRRLRPRLFACGHIHEAWGRRQIDGIPCVNAGAMGPPAGQDMALVVEGENGPRSVTAYRDGGSEPLRRLGGD